MADRLQMQMLLCTQACNEFQHWTRVRDAFLVVSQVNIIGCEDDSLSSIGAAISRFAESAGADLIVASRHSKSAISHLFLGSTTAFLAKSSAVPVVVLP